ncbi:unnamed protein product [Oppiella nova]|uniref:C2H2-type domain-containing protein n=1 Tax=Oppiella nova TaxID=334625 RepID=A0A7R9M973_9ACAR|nr:unnamed protein product [Oppiella nova]CAG2173148.1 unnamed protein product [Oppiella nova]
MDETYSSMADMTRRELYSVVNALKRENNCLKTDLQRFAVISRKCRQYLRDLQNSGHIDSRVTQEILDLIDMNAQKTVIAVDALNVSQRSNTQRNVMSFKLEAMGSGGRPQLQRNVVWLNRQDVDSDGHESDGVTGSADEYEDMDESRDDSLRLTTPKSKRISFATNLVQFSGHNESDGTERLSSAKKLLGTAVCGHRGCHKSFANFRNLDRHQSATHPDIRFFCDRENCFAHFGTAERLTAHKRDDNHLMDCESYECGLNGCQFRALARDVLQEHISCHAFDDLMSDKFFVCDFRGCEKQFRRLDYLMVHKKRHKSADYRCDVDDCGTLFPSHLELVEHLQMVHERYLCEVDGCDFITDLESEVLSHQLIHKTDSQEVDIDLEDSSKGKPKREREDSGDESEVDSTPKATKRSKTNGQYVCEYEGCYKSYTDTRSLREHESTHSGKRFYCDYKGSLRVL